MTPEDRELTRIFVTETREILDGLEPQLASLGSKPEAGPGPLQSAAEQLGLVRNAAANVGQKKVARLLEAAATFLGRLAEGAPIEASVAQPRLADAIGLVRQLLARLEAERDDADLEEQVEQACRRFDEPADSAAPPSPEAAPLSTTASEEHPPADDAHAPQEAAPPPAQEPAAPRPPSSDLDPLELAPQFASESEELLAKAETGLLAAEEDPARASEPFAEAFRAIHSFKGNCGFMGYAPLEQVSHRAETLLDILRNAQQPFPGLSPAVAALLKALDLLRTGLAETARTGQCPADLLAPGVPALEQAIAEARSVGSAPASPSGPAATAAAQPAPSRAEASSSASAVEDAAHAQAAGAQRQDIRVDVQKLDRLVNLVGELVIAEAMVTGHPAIAGLDEESLSRAIHLLRRVSLDLQDVAMSVRMVPLSGAFRKLVRLTHDLSQKLGKKVRLDLLGEETEVDKSVLEHLADPLIHLVRNAVDHGLERPEDRARAGKSEEGRVTVEARHEGGEVLVFVEDDGRGLDRDRIVAKAIERGLLQGTGEKLTDEQVYALIFEPGFSTAKEVSDISGRGVGMDVVRKNIQKLGGSLELRSRAGAGTTVVIHIPLTLAIIDGMLVRVGHARFTLPLLAIREALRPSPEQITVTPDGQEVARVRERLIPVVRLHEVFRRKPDHASLHHGILVIVEVNGHTAGLFADEILGQQQAVIKGLSGYLGKARGVSGCTILGDGEVSLILDVGALLGLAQSGATA